MKDSNVFQRKMKLPYRLVIICSYAKAEQFFNGVAQEPWADDHKIA